MRTFDKQYLTIDDVIRYEEKGTSFRLPEELRKYIVRNVSINSSAIFYRINYALLNMETPSFEYQFTVDFALAILKEYNEAKEDYDAQIVADDKQNISADYDSLIEYILIEGLNFYKPRENKFSHYFLNKVYQQYNSLAVEKLLLLGQDCGGLLGLFIDGPRLGYYLVGSYGEFEIVNYNRNDYPIYRYKSLITPIKYLDYLKKIK